MPIFIVFLSSQGDVDAEFSIIVREAQPLALCSPATGAGEKATKAYISKNVAIPL